MSAVPFIDRGFLCQKLPFIRRDFAQTNYRVYVVDRQSGEHCVWFFGTTLGSWLVYAERRLWRIPWYYADYQVDCQYNAARSAYDRYEVAHTCAWANAEVSLEDTGETMALLDGFATLDEL
ncbi:MAG: hypothetical protein RJA70_2343 [Pseudomonadota bacterium]|jgi:uncharacterized protein YqjF (DUF2071 family)